VVHEPLAACWLVRDQTVRKLRCVGRKRRRHVGFVDTLASSWSDANEWRRRRIIAVSTNSTPKRRNVLPCDSTRHFYICSSVWSEVLRLMRRCYPSGPGREECMRATDPLSSVRTQELRSQANNSRAKRMTQEPNTEHEGRMQRAGPTERGDGYRWCTCFSRTAKRTRPETVVV
jgi:hypothetical protein